MDELFTIPVVEFAEVVGDDVVEEVEAEDNVEVEEDVAEEEMEVVVVIVEETEVAAAEEAVVPALTTSDEFLHAKPFERARGGATKLLQRITLCSPPSVGLWMSEPCGEKKLTKNKEQINGRRGGVVGGRKKSRKIQMPALAVGSGT